MAYSKSMIRFGFLFSLGLLSGCGIPVFGVYPDVVMDPPVGGIFSIAFFISLTALILVMCGHALLAAGWLPDALGDLEDEYNAQLQNKSTASLNKKKKNKDW